MNDHNRTAFISHRADLLQEKYQIFAQLVFSHAVITLQRIAELVQCKTLLTARKSCYHVSGNQLYFSFIHLIISCFCDFQLFWSVLLARIFTPEDKQVERHERRPLETERTGAVRHHILKVRPRPVDYRHEIIRDTMYSAFGQITDALLVILYVSEIFAFTRLDMLMDRNTLHDTPLHPRFSYKFLSFTDFLHRPHFPVRNMMQGMNNIRHASLSDITQFHRIIRSIPSPAFCHSNHINVFFLPQR